MGIQCVVTFKMPFEKPTVVIYIHITIQRHYAVVKY